MQKRFVLGRGAACAVMAAALAAPVAVSDEALRLDVVHSHIQVHRNDDGTLKRGLRNEVESSNWSGYVVSNYATGQTYTAANAKWEVQQVTYQTPAEVCHTIKSGRSRSSSQVCSASRVRAEYSSSWVGIGGNCENATCTKSDNTLIQLGTEQDVSSNGSTQYYAWYEMLPDYPVLIAPNAPNCNDVSCAFPVKPGDSIVAALSCDTNCTPGAEQTWLLTMTDQTQNWTFSKTVTYKSTLASAEWIQEAPASSAGVLPLADYVSANFDPTIDMGLVPSFPTSSNGTPGPDALLMVDPYGEVSAPSIAASLSAFATCWGNDPSKIATCAAP